MRMQRIFSLTALVALFFAAPLMAGEVVVKGVHLCCGGCVSAATGALDGVAGVSAGSADQDAGTVKFQATDAKAAAAGLKAIAGAGLYGSATYEGKKIGVPTTKIDGKAVSNSLTLTGVHLCCGTCVTASSEALKKVKGVSEVDADQDAGSLTVKGKEMNVAQLIEALHEAGFHGNVKK